MVAGRVVGELGAVWPPAAVRGVRCLQTGEAMGVGDGDLGVVAGRNSCWGGNLDSMISEVSELSSLRLY